MMQHPYYSKDDIDCTHDPKFAQVQKIRWDPWVGKHYDKTRILIMGNTTSTEGGEETEGWVIRLKDESFRHIDRSWVTTHGINGKTTPYYNTAKMFLQKQAENTEARRLFWRSVAFFNYCRCPVAGKNDECGCHNDSREVIEKNIEILQPRLCIAWSTELAKFGLLPKECGNETSGRKIGKDIPRFATSPCLIVGVTHPSYWFSNKAPSVWLEFLLSEKYRTPKECRGAVEDFLDHLKAA